MPTEIAKRNSRFNPAARSIAPKQLSDTDLGIIKALAYDRFLCASYLAKLVGSTYGYLTDRCTNLASPPHAYIKISDEQTAPANQRFYIYTKRQFELTKLGQQIAFDKFGIKLPPRKNITSRGIEHQIASDHAMASFRIGVRENAERFAILTRSELLAHSSMPETTRNSPTPDFIPLGDTIESENGRVVLHEIRPDREMFVIRDLPYKKAYFFPGFEVGTGSETHEPRNGRHDHSFTRSKFVDYIAIIQKQIYKSHFGARNFYIPFLEPSPYRIENMMREHLLPMTKDCPELRRFFLFKRIHMFTDNYEASGYLLTEPFQVLSEDGQITQWSMI